MASAMIGNTNRYLESVESGRERLEQQIFGRIEAIAEESLQEDMTEFYNKYIDIIDRNYPLLGQRPLTTYRFICKGSAFYCHSVQVETDPANASTLVSANELPEVIEMEEGREELAFQQFEATLQALSGMSFIEQSAEANELLPSRAFHYQQKDHDRFVRLLDEVFELPPKRIVSY